MDWEELPTVRRIAEIGVKQLGFDHEDLRKAYYAFEKLDVLRKSDRAEAIRRRKEDFERNKEEYKKDMAWLNKYMKLKGFNEDIFRDMLSYELSSDDYDYYYELKTPGQLEEEEARRKEEEKKRMAEKEDGERQ